MVKKIALGVAAFILSTILFGFMLGTLFLIGSLAPVSDYLSPYLEVHSHTWDLHKLNQCSFGNGGGGILCYDENVILEDLKKSRESLGNTTYFCYPFYDYNARAIELLKRAGYTMAFAGEMGTSGYSYVGTDKMLIPRITILSYTSFDKFKSFVS